MAHTSQRLTEWPWVRGDIHLSLPARVEALIDKAARALQRHGCGRRITVILSDRTGVEGDGAMVRISAGCFGLGADPSLHVEGGDADRPSDQGRSSDQVSGAPYHLPQGDGDSNPLGGEED